MEERRCPGCGADLLQSQPHSTGCEHNKARKLYMDRQEMGGAPPHSVFYSAAGKGKYPSHKVSKHAKGARKEASNGKPY